MEEAMKFKQWSHCVGSITGRAQAEERGQVGDYSTDCCVLRRALETWSSQAWLNREPELENTFLY